MAGALMGFGAMFAIMGAVWLIVEAFRTSTDWGLISLVVPFAVIVFVVKKWDRAMAPTVVFLVGLFCFIVGLAALQGGAPQATLVENALAARRC